MIDEKQKKFYEKVFTLNEIMPEVLRLFYNILIIMAFIFILATAVMFFVRTWF